MRRLALAAAIAALAAGCGRSVTVSGTMQEDAEATAVWHYGGDERAEVEADSFRIEGLPGGAIDLRFTDGEGMHARMELREVPSGSTLRLLDVWVEDGVAYPSRVEGAERVVVNGIRMGDAGALPATVDERGVVIAASRAGDALLVRPLTGTLPDLRVVVTPATEVVSPDGDPVPSSGAGVGDTVRVTGGIEGGYVVATRLEVPRLAALREDGAIRGEGGEDDDDGGDRDGRSRPGGERRGPGADEDRRGGQDRGRGRGRGRDG